MSNSPCMDCKDRKTEPNCHNPDICEKWAEYMAVHQKEVNDYKALKKDQYDTKSYIAKAIKRATSKKSRK